MKTKLSAPQILVMGFISVILFGAALLMLPFSTTKGITLVDALFTSTSAVCVTGLTVKDTPADFTVFGQVIILFLVQIGGLGYMTSATIISLLIGKRIGIGERLIMKEELHTLSLEGIVRFTKGVLFVTLLFEITGAVILILRFMQDMEFQKAVFSGIFHSVSAFNNAGFSLFPDNLIRYRGDITVNLVITTLIISGGIGFIVISELYKYRKGEILRLSQHTKVVLITTSILISTGACLIFLFEFTNPDTFRQMTLKEMLFSSYFCSVAPRTAGFNTIDYSSMKIESLFLTIILMFIGASPGSTGGGVKTSAFAIVIMSMCATMSGMRDTIIFKRRINIEIISKSFLIVTLAALLIIVATLFLIKTEGKGYMYSMFEITSAFGTVGLSVGDGGVRSLSALFSSTGKLLISFVMLIGRLGPLTFAYAVMKRKEERYRFPEGRIIIG